MVFNEWFGELTDAQWRADRRHNISSADHDGWVALGWDGDAIARWVCTGASVNVGVDGGFGPRRAVVWHSSGFDSDAVAALVPVVATARRVAVARQPSLFEQSNDMR